MALVKLYRVTGKAQYLALSKFLLDVRGPDGDRGAGRTYNQSQARPVDQTEAVGHAVRAAYMYSGMADVAVETHDVDYQSAVKSLWDNIVHKKYYLTGGVGSGESSEGFGPNYSLRNSSYCEACSSCGEIFFQWKLHLAYHDAQYADLYEQTLYNALYGAMDLDGTTFYYTNPLDANAQRNTWHSCPCCVGNMSRTMLMLPTWTYSKSPSAVHVNLSARQFGREGLADTIADALREYALDASQLELEITESAVMHNAERAAAVLERLHAMGVRVALDDFGTGFSSFAYLKHLPVDFLKIDVEGSDLQALVGAFVPAVEDEAVGVDDRRWTDISGLCPEARTRARARSTEDALGGVVVALALGLRLQALSLPFGRLGDEEREHRPILAEELVHVDDQIFHDGKSGQRCDADALPELLHSHLAGKAVAPVDEQRIGATDPVGTGAANGQ